MSGRAQSLAAIETVASALGELTERVVFVGGTVVALYPIEGAVDLRPTIDVDCVVEVGTASEYYSFVNVLRGRGWSECTDEGAPLCRHLCRDIRVDLMLTSDTALGPTNKWFAEAVREAGIHRLENAHARAITPAYFVATKLEAFRGRGQGDYVASHDLEDLLTVLSGLASLREEIARATAGVEAALRAELVRLMTQDAFVEALPGHFEGEALPGHFEGDASGQARARELRRWLRSLRVT